jgi:hypothetical protein
MAKSKRKKRADYSDDTKPSIGRYGLKRALGCELNHSRHNPPVTTCELCREALEAQERRHGNV